MTFLAQALHELNLAMFVVVFKSAMKQVELVFIRKVKILQEYAILALIIIMARGAAIPVSSIQDITVK